MPEAMHTGEWKREKRESHGIPVSWCSKRGFETLDQLTVGIFEGLFLLGGFGDDLDPFAEEEADVGAVPVQHFHRQHEVFAFIRVADIQRLGCAEVLESTRETFTSALTSIHHV